MAQQVAKSTTDDVDLIGLLERTYFFLRRFRNIFIIAILAGVLLGCVGYFLSPKMYESKLILHPSYLTNQEELEIIDYWNQLLERHEYEILSPNLGCRRELLQNVVSMQGVEIQKNYSSTDPNGFYVEALVRDNSILPELQKAITYGLNHTEYVKQKISEREETLQALIKKITDELTRFDSIKTHLENSIMHEEKNSFPFLQNIEDMNKELIDMNERLLSYTTELKSLRAVQVLQGFIPLNTPVSRSLKTSIAIGCLACLAVAYLFTLLKFVEDRLKKRVKPDA